MGEVNEFTEDEYVSAIKKGDWVVDFWAPWCGPCKIMAPHFEEAARKVKNINFGKIDVEKYSMVAQKLKIMSIPCLIYFRDGQEVHKTIGMLKTEQILDNIKEAFD